MKQIRHGPPNRIKRYAILCRMKSPGWLLYSGTEESPDSTGQ